jgi:hypothetical protein
VSHDTSNSWAAGEQVLVCPVCGAPYRSGDRFCAQCGRYLPSITDAPDQPDWPATEAPATTLLSLAQNPGTNDPETTAEKPAWVFGARPAAVIVGGVLLLVLAAGLLAVGQRDATGTIVMASICIAPLGLLVIVIGIARQVAGAVRQERG